MSDIAFALMGTMYALRLPYDVGLQIPKYNVQVVRPICTFPRRVMLSQYEAAFPLSDSFRREFLVLTPICVVDDQARRANVVKARLRKRL